MVANRRLHFATNVRSTREYHPVLKHRGMSTPQKKTPADSSGDDRQANNAH
jgi:hypothetical protein